MRKDLWILVITGAIVANMYYDNKLFKRLMAWKKYYRMAGVAGFGLLLFLFCRKNPRESQALLQNANEFVRFLPIDHHTSSMLRPVLRYTRLDGSGAAPRPTAHEPAPFHHQDRGVVHGGARTKRSVSETKKKYVAAQQNWRCRDCGDMLTAWFEVDHVHSLESGGTNDASNLVALCRNCHGKKTAFENM